MSAPQWLDIAIPVLLRSARLVVRHRDRALCRRACRRDLSDRARGRRGDGCWPRIAVVAATAATATVAGAYVAFTAAIVVWGFVEIDFPDRRRHGPSRRGSCPPARRGWRARRPCDRGDHPSRNRACSPAAPRSWPSAWGGNNQVALWTYRDPLAHAPQREAQSVPRRAQPARRASAAPSAPPARPFPARSDEPLLPALDHSAAVRCRAISSWLRHRQTSQQPPACCWPHLLALAALEHVFMLIPLPVMNLWNWRRHSAATSEAPVAHPAIEPAPACQGPKVSASITRRGP